MMSGSLAKNQEETPSKRKQRETSWPHRLRSSVPCLRAAIAFLFTKEDQSYESLVAIPAGIVRRPCSSRLGRFYVEIPVNGNTEKVRWCESDEWHASRESKLSEKELLNALKRVLATYGVMDSVEILETLNISSMKIYDFATPPRLKRLVNLSVDRWFRDSSRNSSLEEWYRDKTFINTAYFPDKAEIIESVQKKIEQEEREG
jgi:hypothetical protein